MFKTHFEIMIRRDDRWTIEGIRDDEDRATILALDLLTQANAEAVRVLRRRVGASGREYEKEVFVREAERSAVSVNLAADVDVAPACATLADLDGLAARTTLSAAMRRYLDAQGLTVTEILHNQRELKRILEADGLVFGALARIAAVQARDTGTDAKTRSRALDDLTHQLVLRARHAATAKNQPALGPSGVDGLFRRLSGDDQARRFTARVAISARLVETRDLMRKLDTLLDLFPAEPNADADPVLGGFVAECLMSSALLKELMPFQACLADALETLLLLVKGKFEHRSTAMASESEPVVRLNALFGAKRLPESRLVIFDRIRRELKGTQPLTKQGPGEDMRRFRSLLQSIMTPQGPIGGPPMASALVGRQVRLGGKGGVAALRAAIRNIGACFRTPWDEITFMTDLARSELADLFTEEIALGLNGCLNEAHDIDHLLRALPNRAGRIERIHSLRKTLANLPFEEGYRASYTRRIDDLLARHARKHGDRLPGAAAICQETRSG